MTPVFINPFTDFGFKKIFGQESNKHILIGFLNALFEGEFVVSDLKYRDKEQLPERMHERCVIFDIFCTTSDGEHFILEMQNKTQEFFENRVLYYAARSIVSQGQKGDWDYAYNAVYGIFFMNFTHDILRNDFRSDFGIRNLKNDKPENLQVLTSKLRMVFLQMPVFQKTPEECQTNLDKWTYILKNMETLTQIPWREQDELFEEISKVASREALSEEERNQYDDALRNYRDNIAMLKAAKNEGINEGTQNERSRIARSLLSMNISEDIISQSTGLSSEQIQKLKS